MINKEDKYRTELFELFKDDLTDINEDATILSLLSEIFMAKEDDLDNEILMNKLLK